MTLRPALRHTGWLAVAVAGLCGLVAGCESPAWQTPPPREGLVDAAITTSAGAAAGATQWKRHCAICHGATGDGDGFNAKLLPVPPPTARALVERYGSDPEKRHLDAAIARGSSGSGRGPWCPAWKRTLGDEGVAWVASHLRTLASAPPTPAP